MSEAKQKPMNSNDLKFVETGKGRIYYKFIAGAISRSREIAPAAEPIFAKPTLIFLHGLSANHTTWTAVAEQFNRLGYDCLLPDMRGHGYSDKTKSRSLYHLPVFADDLDLIFKKENLSEVVLIGYSFGGSVALRYAVDHPGSVKNLVLISTNFVSPLDYHGLGFLNFLAYTFVNGFAWSMFWQGRRNYYYYDHATAKGYWHSTFTGWTAMPVCVNHWLLAELLKVDFSADLGKIKCPVLIVRGGNDPFLTKKEAVKMAEGISSSKLVQLDDSSHFLASKNQEQIFQVISGYLNEQKK
jgi:pimeloyl-ACP methyl ester carboxylesterase